MTLNDFHYSLSLLETLYGISIPEEDFEEIALTGWNLIGNKRSKLYRYTTCVSPESKSVELPCNVDILEAVTTDWEDFIHVDNDSPTSRAGSFETEQYIESRKRFLQPQYATGKFINYERVGDTLYFNNYSGKVNLLYRGLVADDDGLPKITDSEAIALATYCAYIIKFKEGLQTNNLAILLNATILKQRWDTLCSQARCDYEWTQNDYDEILDAKTCWDRKIHNRSLKLIR